MSPSVGNRPFHCHDPQSPERHDWEFNGYHQRLCTNMLGDAVGAGWITSPAGGWGDLLFISSASDFSLECELRVETQPGPVETLCTLQTVNPDLAMEVLERAHKGQSTCYESDVSGQAMACASSYRRHLPALTSVCR
ncbi:hypothetical protein [Pseudomonas putida]|uniref:hypothetical protein n=1 Tax=Pseudomonas putida TaxID=303 RepID=UPI0039068CEA